MNNIRKIRSFLFLFALMLIPDILPGQEIDSIQYIDSLVEVLVRERRNWNEASRLLIDLGEPAVDPLLKILNDRSTGEWSRRKAAITLADIPAQRMAAPCIRICQDTTESMNLRIDAGRALKGKNISSYEKVFLEALQNENPFVRPVALR